MPVGATTIDEYRKYIEKGRGRSSGASSRSLSASRRSRIRSRSSAASRSGNEIHHGVKITDSALIAAAVFRTAISPTAFCRTKPSTSSTRPPRSCGSSIDSIPTELDEVERRAKQLEFERQALKNDSSKKATDRLEALERELAS